jgi:hypothetical protein
MACRSRRPSRPSKTAFEDPRHVLVDDGAGNGGYVLIGFSLRGRLLTVVHVERGRRERIVSAWLASAKEGLVAPPPLGEMKGRAVNDRASRDQDVLTRWAFGEGRSIRHHNRL